MIYGFDTEHEHEAVAALCVYVVYRSRDTKRYKVTPDMWSQIERFTRASAKRSRTIPDFIEKLKPRLMAGTLNPRWMRVGMSGYIPMVVTDDGMRLSVGTDDDMREFMTGIVASADQRRVMKALNDNSAWVILLVRDRLEKERVIERRFADAFAAEDVIDA